MSVYWEGDGIVLHHGNCVTIMADMPEHSVDAIVCDPPYELGFMGKTWDSTGVAYDPETWRAALRVLKPGGHMLAFGGTRTAHRLAVAVEDAGFEIRDSIAWLYGCLDRDSQVLTNQGWRYGLDLTGSEDVAQWNTDGSIEFVRPSHVHRYPFDGQMVRFLSADTDQLLTPNHRVYSQQYERTMTAGVRVGRWGDWRVDEAGTINRWQRRRFPVAGKHDGPGIGGVDYAALLGWVWTDGGFDHSPSTGVRVYQSSVNRAKCDEIAGILDRLAPHKRYDYKRTWAYKATVRDYVASTWFFTGDLAQRVRSDLPDKRPTYDLLLRMTQEEKVAFCDAAMKGDGSHGQFYQKNRDDLEWFQALCTLTGQRSVLGMRKAPRDGGAVYTHQQATTELQRRHLRESTVDYVGDVWCVTVPSGAFVARRNGKVFVTGNSGFPKSLDVSKAIDKAAGAEREIIGHRAYGDGQTYQGGSAAGRSAGHMGEVVARQPSYETAPATDAARKWQGWGTALKPAHEPLVWGIKPAGPGVVLTEIGSHLDRLESEWLALDQDLPTRTGAGEDSPERTGTSPSESAAITSWNTVTSWKLSWVELSEVTSTSTTSTASRMTTDLRTLSSYLAEITATSMLTSLTNPSGPTSIVSAADNLFASVIYGSRATRARSADENATALTHTAPPEGTGGRYEPIVVARKPLSEGTVAANVLEHGTGALNIDGCRVETTDNLGGGAYAEVGNRTESASLHGGSGMNVPGKTVGREFQQPAGRWPANVVLDEVHEQVLRLRYNLPVEAERTIREFFNASTDHLPRLRDSTDGATEQTEPNAFLLPEVLRPVDEPQPDRRERDPLATGTHGGVAPEDAGRAGGEGAARISESSVDGRDLPQPGIHPRSGASVDFCRTGDLLLDAQRIDGSGVHTGAPSGRSQISGATVEVNGACPSPERSEGRQSPGEPGTPLERGPQTGTHRGGARGLSAASGERNTPGSALEVLRCDVPPPWLSYFEDTGRTVRGGQAAALDQQSGEASYNPAGVFGVSKRNTEKGQGIYGNGDGIPTKGIGVFGYGDKGGASRFFYVTREEPCKVHEVKRCTICLVPAPDVDNIDARFKYCAKAPKNERPTVDGVNHPTVKPLALMRWLVRLVTPPGGTVLDPFAGSGTTVEAAILEGFAAVGIEQDAAYLPLIQERIRRCQQQPADPDEPTLFGDAS